MNTVQKISNVETNPFFCIRVGVLQESQYSVIEWIGMEDDCYQDMDLLIYQALLAIIE